MQNQDWEQEERLAGDQQTAPAANHSMWHSDKSPLHQMWSLPETADERDK